MSLDPGNGPSNSSVREHFYRQFEQEETSLRERLTRLKGTELQPVERASITDHCLASISQLSNAVKEASAYLPAYDQRTYSTAVKSLDETLQEIRSAAAPKRKFAFKKRPAQKKNIANSGNGLAEDMSVQSRKDTGDSFKTTVSSDEAYPKQTQDSLDARPPSGTSSAITITSLSSAYQRLDSTSLNPASSISITQIHHSATDLSASISNPLATLSVNTVTSSLLLCGRISGAAHITAVRNSTLIVWSRQLRMHECDDCLVYLRCGSRPIIEDCKGIRFAPFPSVYDTVESPRPGSPDMWDQVDDFGWLRAEHSPNWSTLRPGDEGTVENGSWEIIKLFASPGGTLSELDGLLRAAKVM